MDNNADSKFELLNNTLDFKDVQCIKEIIYALHLGNSFRLNEHRQVYFDKILLLGETDETVISNIVGNNILDNEKLENIKIIKVKDVTSDKIYKCGNKESIFLFLTECRIYNGGESTMRISPGTCYMCKNTEFAIVEPEKALILTAEVEKGEMEEEKKSKEEEEKKEKGKEKEEEEVRKQSHIKLRNSLSTLSQCINNGTFKEALGSALSETNDSDMLLEILIIIDKFLGRNYEYFMIRNLIFQFSDKFNTDILGMEVVKTASIIREIRKTPLCQMIENINKSFQEQALKEPYAISYDYLLPKSIIDEKIVKEIISHYNDFSCVKMTYKRKYDQTIGALVYELTYTP